jgi:DNA adenine methylase
MTEDQHQEMIGTIKQCQGKVLLSGYPNELYDRELADWRHHDFEIDNKVSGAKTKPVMVERVWMNY